MFLRLLGGGLGAGGACELPTGCAAVGGGGVDESGAGECFGGCEDGAGWVAGVGHEVVEAAGSGAGDGFEYFALFSGEVVSGAGVGRFGFGGCVDGADEFDDVLGVGDDGGVVVAQDGVAAGGGAAGDGSWDGADGSAEVGCVVDGVECAGSGGCFDDDGAVGECGEESVALEEAEAFDGGSGWVFAEDESLVADAVEEGVVAAGVGDVDAAAEDCDGGAGGLSVVFGGCECALVGGAVDADGGS